jgi:phosphoacetylglucosamine mutase
VVFDGAHGIGAPKLLALAPHLEGLVTLEVRNGVEGPGALNDGVGAEHVQKTRTPPAGVSAAGDAGLRLASVDGDADRLVYHFFDATVGGGFAPPAMLGTGLGQLCSTNNLFTFVAHPWWKA